jgi:putative Mg2+ transporter-C (MgtC) family protein
MTAIEMLMRVGLATALGIAIGIERQWRSRMAGLQTMALVSMGSALFLILGAYTFHRDTDPTVSPRKSSPASAFSVPASS